MQHDDFEGEERPHGYYAWRKRQHAPPPPRPEPPPPSEPPQWEAPRPVFVRRRRSCTGHKAPRLFFAVVLIIAGVALFLSNLGLLPIERIWNLWPLLLMGAGVGKLSDRRRPSASVVGAVMIAIGAVFLLVNLGLLHVHTHDDSWPLSLLLIIAGTVALVKVLESGSPAASVMGFRPIQTGGRPNLLNDWVILGAVKRKIDTANFQGGQILNILGAVELDLSRANIPGPDRSAVIDVNVIFGAVKLKLPDTWRLAIHGAGVLGNFEDKTIPRALTLDAPNLIITGYSIFSAVEIEN
jgi:predicted membrane protein